MDFWEKQKKRYFYFIKSGIILRKKAGKIGWRNCFARRAALVGMQLYQQLGKFQKAFDIGNAALELLREQNSQHYAYPLFLSLIDVGEKLKETNRAPENLHQLKDFQDAFQTVYQENHLPCMRMAEGQCRKLL